METYSVPSWSFRRCAGEVRDWLQEQSGAVSWGEAIYSPPLLAFKAGTSVLIFVLPENPTFSQLDGINQDLAQVLDLAEEQLRGRQKFRVIGKGGRPQWVDKTAIAGCIGVVFVWPAGFGGDP